MNENWPYIKENIKRFPEYKASIFEQGFLITNHNWRRVSLLWKLAEGEPFGQLSYLASLSAKAIRHGKEWDYLLSDWPRI